MNDQINRAAGEDVATPTGDGSAAPVEFLVRCLHSTGEYLRNSPPELVENATPEERRELLTQAIDNYMANHGPGLRFVQIAMQRQLGFEPSLWEIAVISHANFNDPFMVTKDKDIIRAATAYFMNRYGSLSQGGASNG